MLLSIYTPTFRRPAGLARCIKSVQDQTRVRDLEHVIVVDHVGVGIEGMYAAVPRYAAALSGQYVFMLADDDVLASPSVVEDFHTFISEYTIRPPLVICDVANGGARWPDAVQDEFLSLNGPIAGRIGLGCTIMRGDVWRRFSACWGQRYEGDYDFLKAVWDAGEHHWARWHYLFSHGPVSRGAPEA